MVVRIRFGKGPKVGRKRAKEQAAGAGRGRPADARGVWPRLLALWRIAADLNWTSSFAISSGFFLPLAGLAGRGGAAATVRARAESLREEGERSRQRTS